jgi:hypothetical protein
MVAWAHLPVCKNFDQMSQNKLLLSHLLESAGLRNILISKENSLNNFSIPIFASTTLGTFLISESPQFKLR